MVAWGCFFHPRSEWGGSRPWAQIIQTPIIISFPIFPNYTFKEWLSQKYVDERMSCEEIAEIEKCGRTTILKYLKLYKIEVRKSARKYKAGCGLAYGEKVRHNRHMRHKKEDQNIEIMKELRRKGRTYRKIAEILNRDGVITKTKKGLWCGKSVWQVLNRAHNVSSEVNI